MPGNPQPLVNNQRVVKPDGTPTEYFIRWAQQRQIDISDGITAAQAQQLIDDWAAARRIIAGNGLDGGGFLSGDVTIDANASDILDLIGNTRGSVLYRGAAGWAVLGPGTAGKVLQTNGAGADPTWVTPSAGGGGAFGEFAQSPPLAATLGTAVTPATVTVSVSDNTGKGLGFKVTSGASGRGAARLQAAPATPFCVVARMSGFVGMAGAIPTEFGFGIALRNSANGRMLFAYKYSDRNIYLQQWDDPTTFNASLATGPGDHMLSTPNYFAVSVTAANVIQFYYSNNGVHWEPFGGTIALATYILAIDQVGISMFTQSVASRVCYTLTEFWRVDATIPPAVAL